MKERYDGSRRLFPLSSLQVLLGVAAIMALTLGVFGMAKSSLFMSGAWFSDDERVAVVIEVGEWIVPTPTAPAQAGTTLTAHKDAAGFAEQSVDGYVFGVRGEICIKNEGNYPTEGLEIVDTIQYKIKGEKFIDYLSQVIDSGMMPALEAGQEHCYPYELVFSLPSGENIEYRNKVNVTILNHSGWLPGGIHCPGPDPCRFGVEEKADFSLPEEGIDPKKFVPTVPVMPTETQQPTLTPPPVPTPPIAPIPTVPGLVPTFPSEVSSTPTEMSSPTGTPDFTPTASQTPMATDTQSLE